MGILLAEISPGGRRGHPAAAVSAAAAAAAPSGVAQYQAIHFLVDRCHIQYA